MLTATVAAGLDLTYTPPTAAPAPRIFELMTVAVDDTRGSPTVIRYDDPTTQLVMTVGDVYHGSWSKQLGPFTSVWGNLWLEVDNTHGLAMAHCSLRVTGYTVATTDIEVGQIGQCFLPLRTAP